MKIYFTFYSKEDQGKEGSNLNVKTFVSITRELVVPVSEYLILASPCNNLTSEGTAVTFRTKQVLPNHYAMGTF